MSFIILGWRFISSKDSMGANATRVLGEISMSTLNLALISMICFLVKCNLKLRLLTCN